MAFVLHLPQAFPRDPCPYRKNLINNQDLVLSDGSHGESKSYIHSGYASTFLRAIEEPRNFRQIPLSPRISFRFRPSTFRGWPRSRRCFPVRSILVLNPVPTSERLAIRPRKITLPSVGSVILHRIFNSVDLPAPSADNTQHLTSLNLKIQFSATIFLLISSP